MKYHPWGKSESGVSWKHFLEFQEIDHVSELNAFDRIVSEKPFPNKEIRLRRAYDEQSEGFHC